MASESDSYQKLELKFLRQKIATVRWLFIIKLMIYVHYDSHHNSMKNNILSSSIFPVHILVYTDNNLK